MAEELERIDGILTRRGDRRRFLAGISAAALTPASVAPEARLSPEARDVGGAIMARQTDQTTENNSLGVPGASLYYETSGSGPMLLLIPGGGADAAVFAPIVDLLAELYTVVRYDPRGVSRSPLEGPAQDVPLEVHADDAQRLLLAIGNKPAFVLGSSGGAVIGLALVERHPEQVQTLVAHEPPVVTLLPEGDPRREAIQEIYDTYLKEGVEPAMAKFMAAAGLGEPAPSESTPEAQVPLSPEAMARMQQNLDFFLAHYLLPITAYVPDIAALQAASSRVVVGIGEESGGQLAHDTALALAERLGTPPVTFPGGHGGFVTHPAASVAKVQEVLRAT